jgi:hypothetical protein
MRTGRKHFFLAYTSPEFVLEIDWTKGLGELRRVIDMGWSKERLLDALFWRSRSSCFLRVEHERRYEHHVRAATQAIVT